ncbi:hypothetical protein AB0K60_36400 [Thermopolyspora sp. NPDC052614]|uniref:hypothetical protein n=1 Tax=Thermopolyspora sp. NPDC052614 TaxID=3155682 RepID=UPI0034222F5B
MKRISLAVAGLVAAGVLGVGASPAAAVADTAKASATAGSASLRLPGNLPNLRGKYWTFSGCQQAGHDGIGRGHWTQFHCSRGTLQWVLWTD